MCDCRWLSRVVGCGLLLSWGAGTVFGQVDLVRDREIRAVVVTAARPSQVAEYAVEELVNHVEQATGLQLPVATETTSPEITKAASTWG